MRLSRSGRCTARFGGLSPSIQKHAHPGVDTDYVRCLISAPQPNSKNTIMKISPLSILAALVISFTGCTSVGPVRFPKPTEAFAPKRNYSVAYAAAWQKVQFTLDNARISIVSANKDETVGRIQTDYVDGETALIAGGLVGSQSTRYRYSITVRPDGDKTNIGIVCRLESTFKGGGGASQWTDVSGQNVPRVTQLENWLCEQIEKNL